MQVNFNNYQDFRKLIDSSVNKEKFYTEKSDTDDFKIKEIYLDFMQKYIKRLSEQNFDDETIAEIENTEAEIYSARITIKWEMEELQSNQQVAQIASSAFVKMITDTTDIAGREIVANFSNIVLQFNELRAGNISLSDCKSKISEIKSAIEETLCKLEIQLTLSNAALRANEIIEQMKKAGVDDSEIRELFENYANNMDTSIAGKTQFDKKTTGNKNISLTADDKEIDKKINDLKRKISEEKSKLKSKTISIQERQQLQARLDGHIFLLDMYSSIKKAISGQSKNLFDLFK